MKNKYSYIKIGILVVSISSISIFSIADAAQQQGEDTDIEDSSNFGKIKSDLDRSDTQSGLSNNRVTVAKNVKKYDEGERGYSTDYTQVESETLEASSPTVRRFHEVLDELLAEFGYDIKMGQLKGLKNISIRKVEVSDTLPRSYTSYVELLAAERIREHSKVRIISCIPCKTKKSKLIEGKLYITSPLTNMSEMLRAADQLGIENFMDVVLVYHTTHMVLAFQIFNTSTKEMVWARTYNSETIKSRFQKMAVDYSQIEKSRPGEEYVADFRYVVGVGGAAVPNVAGNAGDSSMLALHLRGSERFNNRKTEFGLQLSYFHSTKSLLNDYPVDKATNPSTEEIETETVTEEDSPKPFTSALAIYAIYCHNFLGQLESYNQTRTGINIGIGGLFATGYLAGTARLGGDIYFGRSFLVSLGGIYIVPSRILVNNDYVKTKGGSGGEIIFAYNF